MSIIDVIVPFKMLTREMCDFLVNTLESQTIINDCVVTFVDDNSDYFSMLERRLLKSRINYRVIHNTSTKGPGFSRQRAINSTECEYVFFLDADDGFCNSNSLELLYNKIILGYNVVCCNIRVQDVNSKEELAYDKRVEDYNRPDSLFPIPTDIHGNIYSVKFLRDENIRFPNLFMHEDYVFYNQLIFSNKIRPGFVMEKCYLYNRGVTFSLTGSFTTNSERLIAGCLAHIVILDLLFTKKRFIKPEIFRKVYEYLISFILNYSFLEQERIDRMSQQERARLFAISFYFLQFINKNVLVEKQIKDFNSSKALDSELPTYSDALLLIDKCKSDSTKVEFIGKNYSWKELEFIIEDTIVGSSIISPESYDIICGGSYYDNLYN